MTQYMCSASWTEESSLAQTLEFLSEQALVHAAEAGPYSDSLRKIISGGDWGGVVGFSIDYNRGSPMELYHCRQSLALFQKLEALPLGVDKEAVAWSKFLEAEQLCRATNVRLRSSDPSVNSYPVGVASVLLTAQRKISEILGDVPKWSELKLAFGPGANVGIKASASSARWKLNSPLRCSANMVPALQSALEEVPSIIDVHRQFPRTDWKPLDYNDNTSVFSAELLSRIEDYLDRASVVVEVVDGTLSFAKKNAKTFRSIVVEPPFNTLFQKGCGSLIRGRLRNAGLILDTLAARNKAYAQVSSVDGRLATVDLSMASDTISKEAVSELLPYPWYSFLSNFRTGSVRYKDQVVHLEKFSSMGNAFTFELESLLFYGLAYGCTASLGLDCSEVTSFGDDIILPTEAADLLYKTLEYLGFVVNEEKSFTSGPFRESCGGDYVHGIDIRPYYQKDLVSGQTLFALHNYYMRTMQFDYAARVVEHIHPSLLLWGPDGYGDGHLIGTWENELNRKVQYIGQYCGSTFETFSLKQRHQFNRCQKGDWVLPVYSVYSQGPVDPLAYLEANDLCYSEKRHMATDHFVVRGDCGYKRISIYTFRQDVFLKV